MAEDQTSTLIEIYPRNEHKRHQGKLYEEFTDVLATAPPTEQSANRFEELLRCGEFAKCVDGRTATDIRDTIPEPRSFLSRARLQGVLAIMLQDIAKYIDYLKPFIAHFEAENERIEPQYIVKTKHAENGRANGAHQVDLPGDLDAPLHWAARQLNGDFVEWLLARGTLVQVKVNLRNKSKETALAILCVKYNHCHRKRNEPSTRAQLATIQKLIKRLLEAGGDFNIYTTNVGLPFDLLRNHLQAPDAVEETKQFVQDCITLAARALVVSVKSVVNHQPKRVLQFYNSTAKVEITVELLEIFLRFNDEAEFAKYWRQFHVSETVVAEVIKLVLHTAIDQTLSGCADLVLTKAGPLMFKERKAESDQGKEGKENEGKELVHRVELKGLLKKVCLKGNLSLLKWLLWKVNDRLLLNETPLLVVTLNKAQKPKHAEEQGALLACAELLVNKHQNIHMYNAGSDGNTPLHLALKFGFEPLALLMLKQGHGLLGITNHNNLTPVDYGTQQFWESYLDGCITTQDRTVLRFDLNCLRPTETAQARKGKAVATGWQVMQPVKEVQSSQCHFTRTVTEMTTLRLIAQSKERNRLLMHPTFTSFIALKWKRLCHWNYLNFLLSALTMLFFAWYSLTACSSEGSSVSLMALSSVGAILMFTRELVQWWLLGWSYFSLENTVDMANVVGMFVVLLWGCIDLLSSFVVISLALEVSFLLGSLSFTNLSTMLYMFQTVSKNFFQSFLLFATLIGSFIYGFYLTNNVSSPGSSTASCNESCSEENFNNFRSFWNATIKTLVMTTGEFEAANVDFDSGKFSLFLAFLFVAPIVILNLINGLAVSDIAAIREQAELISICKKVELLERYERGVANVRPEMNGKLRQLFLKPFFPEPFFVEHKGWLYVMPNELNKIGLHRRNANGNGTVNTADHAASTRKTDLEPLPLFPLLPRHFLDVRFDVPFTLFMQLDQSIVDKAMEIADKRFKSTPTEPNPAIKTLQDTIERQAMEHQAQMKEVLKMLRDIKQQLRPDGGGGDAQSGEAGETNSTVTAKGQSGDQ